MDAARSGELTPELLLLYKALEGIPATSVDSERAFRNIINQFCFNLIGLLIQKFRHAFSFIFDFVTIKQIKGFSLPATSTNVIAKYVVQGQTFCFDAYR